jgi:Fe-S cluster biogenesis protein NfuA
VLTSETDVKERVAELDGLLQEIEAIEDESARTTSVATIQTLLELYGEAMARIIARVGPEMSQSLAGDELIAHLLLVHGLHPLPLEVRVRAALDSVRPYLESHGGDVELLRIVNGIAYLRLQGTCTGCSSSETTLKGLIERTLLDAAPDLEAIETEGTAAAAGSFVALECLR